MKAVVDTGYTGDLMLPIAVINALQLTRRATQEAVLGDGSIKIFEMYAGNVIWDGKVRRVEINASEAGALVGMGLLEDYKLELEGRSNGQVRITPLAQL